MSAAASIAIEPGHAPALRAEVDAFLDGERPMSGLELYYLLEAVTPLREFHTMLRSGAQNRMRSGLQQSYGDHNRLLLLGLDRLCVGDLAWFRSRLVDPDEIDEQRLRACFDAVGRLELGPAERIALWVGAALHDCGMLTGRATGIDVEDGVVLARDMVDELCPPEVRALALFAVRNHDYVKDLFRGEVPVRFLTDQCAELDPAQRDIAVAVLGMIQVAGAASLGEGRLSGFRISIFEQCMSGEVFRDPSPVSRLARLLHDGTENTRVPPTGTAESALSNVAVPRHDAWIRFLDAVPVHGWHRAWARDDRGADATEAKTSVLDRMVTIWDETGVDHILLAPSGTFPTCGTEWRPACEQQTLCNGTAAAILR